MKRMFMERNQHTLAQIERQHDSQLSIAQEAWLMLGHRFFAANYGSQQDCHAEASFIALHFPEWNRHIARTLLVWVVIMALHSAVDHSVYSDAERPSSVRTDRLYATIACGVVVIIALALMSHPRCQRFFFRRSIEIVVIALLGVGGWCITVTSLVSVPSYALLIIFITWQYTVAVIPLFFRLVVAMVVVALHMLLNANKDKFDMLLHLGFLAAFSILSVLPAYTQDSFERVSHNTRLVIERQHKLLKQEKLYSDNLLNNLLPPPVVAQLKGGRHMIADSFERVSVIFTDMKGFTAFSSQTTPVELVNFLNRMYSCFDMISAKHNVYKVEIIGDAYYAVTGCPQPCDDHAQRAVRASIAYQATMPELRAAANAAFQIRIGIHTGPVVAGVVGLKDPRYHLFGDTVNYAEEMESNGVPDKVHISQECYEALGAQFLEREVPFTARPKASRARAQADLEAEAAAATRAEAEEAGQAEARTQALLTATPQPKTPVAPSSSSKKRSVQRKMSFV
eukprot:g7889.t1